MVGKKAYKALSEDGRIAMFMELQAMSVNGKLPKKSIDKMADKFDVSHATVKRIWARRKEASSAEDIPAAVRTKRKGRCGRHRIDSKKVGDALKSAPLTRRRTVRDAAEVCGIAHSTLWKILSRQEIRRVSTSIKPLLTKQNKIDRLKWALSFVDGESLNFDSMHSDIHLDEKWFYMCKETNTFYLAHDEPDPVVVGKSKRFIPKVMFLCALARPRFDEDSRCTFDGKIGLWPFTEIVLAKRNSRNRPAGTPEIKNVSVTKEVYKSYLLNKVIPEVCAKWPGPRPLNARMIQDNAPVHCASDDPDIVAACSRHRNKLLLECQTPNSPDYNVNDLGFFRSIQSLQYKKAPTTVDELIHAVMEAFNEFQPRKIDDNFITLQKCLEASMKDSGGNRYKQPHMNKKRRRNAGEVINNVVCDRSIYNLARNLVKEPQ